MEDNPLKQLRIASAVLNSELSVMRKIDKGKLQKLLDALNAEAHKFGLLVRIEVGK